MRTVVLKLYGDGWVNRYRYLVALLVVISFRR